MIKIENLKKSYNGAPVLDIDELNINEGNSFGLVGNNGAGKTTLFRLILDLIKADTGWVESKGIDVKKTSDWKTYTGSFIDEGFLIDFLSAEEYFNFIAKINSVSKSELDALIDEFSDFFGNEILNQKKYIRDFSKGNQKKIGIFAAIMSQPEVLVLDEPFANLDPSSQIRLKQLLKKLREEKNVCMLISSHDLNHVTEVCERIVVLEKGRLMKDIQTSEDTLTDLECYFSAEIVS
ncbi:ABC transporter ATP-binding protein [Ancylomarina sp. DW003]|nr:ABC transporter ATP-binding protein [Ancylomarina sp. DW003]MDE5424177.1 ABC transporter ATP-binding protein [Ancylomarina sp. DW003]